MLPNDNVYSTLRGVGGVEFVRVSLNLDTWEVDGVQRPGVVTDLVLIPRYALAAYIVRNHGFTDDPRVSAAVKTLLWCGSPEEGLALTIADLVDEMRSNRFYRKLPEGNVEFGPLSGDFYFTVAVESGRALVVGNILKFGAEMRLLNGHAKQELERVPDWRSSKK